MASTKADVREGHSEAYYVPGSDFISMPAFKAFKGADHFYNVAFHELTSGPVTSPASRAISRAVSIARPMRPRS